MKIFVTGRETRSQFAAPNRNQKRKRGWCGIHPWPCTPRLRFGLGCGGPSSRTQSLARFAAFWAFSLLIAASSAADDLIPHLRRQGTATQLIVEGKPFVMLAGELHNSSASGTAYMQGMWPHLRELGLNTVIAPASWELVEPEEGRFDFGCVDAMVDLARKHGQRLVLLWFGSWKNGVSSYAPVWVLQDTARFPRAKGSSHQNTKDMLSTFSPNNLKADAAAFAGLMRHLKQTDGDRHTVVMVQVENEVGIKPETRDLSDEATRVYQSAVPPQLVDYLVKHKDALDPNVLDRWGKSGFATAGTWPEVFGGGPEAEEIFSAWHYARYIDQVAAAGQAEYGLPMYVNAWLAATKLGTYPTGGPVAHVYDVWRAAAPHIALLAPDIYVGEFKQVCAAYTRAGNPLLIPEASRDNDAAARAYWAIAQHAGLGFAPFGIESMKQDHPLVDTYRILRQLMPAIVEAHGTGRMIGVFRQGSEESPGLVDLGDYAARINYEQRLPPSHAPVGGLVIQTGPQEFLMAGYGFNCQFQAKTPGPRQTRIQSIELGQFDDAGKWVHELWLNGDETGANYAARIPPFTGNEFLGANRPMILRVKVYRHD